MIGQLQNFNGVYYSGPNGGPGGVYGTGKTGVTFGAQLEAWF
jgi:hypothetical protein